MAADPKPLKVVPSPRPWSGCLLWDPIGIGAAMPSASSHPTPACSLPVPWAIRSLLVCVAALRAQAGLQTPGLLVWDLPLCGLGQVTSLSVPSFSHL